MAGQFCRYPLSYVWIGSQFFEDKKIKSVSYGKSLVLHTKALENLSDKMEAYLACQVKDEVHAKSLKAMLHARFSRRLF